MSALRMHAASAADDGLRLDVMLSERGLYPSRSAAAKACAEGAVLVNGQAAGKNATVRQGDAVVYPAYEQVEPGPLRGEPIPLDIRYEDDEMLVLSKQVGLVCHPSEDHREGTLVNALLHHCGPEHLCNVQGERDRMGIVHRLDMDTSGLMLAAKTDEAGEDLMNQIRERSVDRHYLALVHGVIAHDTGMVDAPIARSARDRKRMAVRDVDSARDAVTTFTVLERFEAERFDDGYTLVDCKLFTGRTHQIRVHMEYVRHPLVGEPVYTACMPKRPEANLGLGRQFLHSYRLGFTHPRTQQHLQLADSLPADLRAALDCLQQRSRGRTAEGERAFALMAASPTPCVEGEALGLA
ncbi:RluA family pseudouridine synthase [Berryella wangjianweii]|uniref:Pseudouridine synthase n=1 Tax=Berryella wangjianweii TaxID=2734634 RepID=A0A6M8J066_9ACTN|nr:RluA family pseudouridine synthase [Berryella wangjianweii]QKF06947.1 RluA family pseudouridine synthase [Berryella wangjianweii]